VTLDGISELAAAARAVLNEATPAGKLALTRSAAEAWTTGALSLGGPAGAPDHPARPERPVLLSPGRMPRRRKGVGAANRIALLHALAHIELNAVDLAWDLIARFTDAALPREFWSDWIAVAADEARHFALIDARLGELDAAYGDLPAHDGLWAAARATGHDLLARLAVVPLVLEARGLDVTPPMIERLRRAGDERSVAILETVYRDEIDHVAAGSRWFRHLCAERGIDPAATWRALVSEHYKAPLKAPFNRPARDAAGLDASFYEPLAGVVE
jgi:uncharacterized ferritin-like protein (DUF455 family)